MQFTSLKRLRVVPILFAATLFGCGSGLNSAQSAPPTAPTTLSITFTATNTDFANPERGFYKAAPTDLDKLTPAYIDDAYSKGYRLIYARINLEAYRDTDLPADYLNRLDTAFATARAGGVKLIVRATYNYPRGETEYRDAKDASLSRILSHLSQLKPVFQSNVDVIAFVQAGFIGAWGEWHTSSNDLTSPANRTAIKDALLDAVPSTRFIQFRYPPYVHDWYPTLSGLDAAFMGAFRVGFHNDCFLASQTDVGTYDEDAGTRAVQQAYNDAQGDLAPFGGETCNPADEASPTPRTACSDILSEGARFNLTYLNDGYYRRLFHDNWTKNGCMAEVRRNMGYRFGLVGASHAATANRDAVFAVDITVRNSGWARLYNPRPVEILLRSGSTVRRIETTGGDPRRWLPGAETAQTLSLTIPSDLPVGSYDVLLALPDADSRIKSDMRYAVRLANADSLAKNQAWESSLGAFVLGTYVEVR
ncbi:hypothetical protein ABI_11460 [Asticcacaulis biprosthecium C19]|uniref:DUF4832 domain-containing protein n=1 Tax=Asticcacaulis biprosthecium C19 TaxID=715226 RepID=F4QHH2_9CAUL|nr:DUF4832 domain-containing protein [Asticcacaulis biprosthecium]EGF92709.1 hypothetical protein ABI_11460 [Asticcacaulis biprosthecium C19]